MSSYGEDYSDKEQNYIEHGGASQGEGDVKGDGTGEVVANSCNRDRSEYGRGFMNSEGGVVTGGHHTSGAQDTSNNHTHTEFGSISSSSAFNGSRDEAKETHSSWDFYQQSTDNRGEVGSPAEAPTIIGKKHDKKESKASRRDWYEAEGRPMGSLTAEEFCERLKLFQNPNVSILVGPEEVAFAISKALLCQNSSFFDRAFNGKFKEAAEGVIRLPEDTVVAFQMMLQWKYTGDIVVPDGSDCCDGFGKTATFLSFFKLADKIDLFGPLSSMFQKFREHLSDGTASSTRSNCNDEDKAGVPCTCGSRKCIRGLRQGS